MSKNPIYLDNHATTIIDPRVLAVMDPWLHNCYGNPASRSHQHGWQAEEAVELARLQVATLVSVQPSEIIFTAGATESNNTVLKGVSNGIVTTEIEHKSILAPCSWLSSRPNFCVFVAKVDKTGTVDLKHLISLINHNIGLVSVMLANNEVGSIQPIGEIVKRTPKEVFVHSDMAQAVGKIPVDLVALGVHFASFSAHKMYGPKGVGALYVREDVSHLLTPLIHGGGQEHGFRSGTLNVPAIVGFGKACEIAKIELAIDSLRICNLRNKLENLLIASIPDVIIHGGTNRLTGNLSLSLPCKDINTFMAYTAEKVSLSFGSACMSNSGKSHVLKAMGISDDEAQRTIRIGIGRFNTEEEIVEAAKVLICALDKANNGG
jgi:cysteine desulfurase